MAGDVAAGRRIYRDGILPSGTPMTGLVQGDVEARGASAACATCHRRSGYGSNEGGSVVPPITGPALFRDREPNRGDLFRSLFQDPLPSTAKAAVRTPRTRPAYTEKMLAVSLREGKDPAGRLLDPLMPRYAISDEDIGHLTSYLRTVGSDADPGVDPTRIHFATVVSEGVDLGERTAMTAVLDAFVRRKNLEVRGERRPGFSLHYKSEFEEARREWVLHIWELHGPPQTWEAQLVSCYRRQPVFAMLGGRVEGAWRPVHEFCERFEVPCLFPATDLPHIADAETVPATRTMYLSRGLTLEAEALAEWISEENSIPNSLRLVQVYRTGEEGETLATTFRRSLDAGCRARLEDRPVTGPGLPTRDFWRSLLRDPTLSTLVLWLRPADLSTYPRRPGEPSVSSLLCLSAGLLGGTIGPPVRVELGEVRLTWPQSLPGAEDPSVYRVRSWLGSQRLAMDHERIQLNMYFALLVAEHALVRMVAHFSRDYFLECVEHEAENTPNPGVFPRLSLGPGQRFASKGCFIVSPSRTPGSGVDPVSGWIVP
jgi:hypothetical protein